MEQVSHLPLSDDEYTVKQTSVRNEYEARDARGNTILRGNHEMFELQDTFQFTDTDGDEVFTVEATGTMDIAGDYLLTDNRTGEDTVILDNDFSILQDTWRIRDADDQSLLAEMNSRGALYTVGRKLLPIGGWIPRRYEITDEAGDHVGVIEEQVSARDQYEISIEDAGTVPTESIVVGAMVIDAIQG